MVVYSKECWAKSDTYWNSQLGQCEPCEKRFRTKAGYGFAQNCGLQDDGGRTVPLHKPCENGTFNNGSFVACRKCRSCPPGQQALALCNTTTDTQCCEKEMVSHGKCRRPETTTPPREAPTDRDSNPGPPCCEATVLPTAPPELTSQSMTSLPPEGSSGPSYHYAWIAAVLLLFLVGLLQLIFKDKKMKCYRKGDPSHVKKNMNLLPHKDKKVDELLAPRIQEAPLQTVLDNLDVLEELVMLLDPENSVAKTTRHVATRCSFSATWINYAYSMRDIKSPLKSVLEAVTTKFPEWTVGHLARVFHDIDRNDAVAVLAKLKEKPRLHSQEVLLLY
ncbi:IGF-like family receptor 1 [Conger conger]|nr:IGF-like family receptor 1 [Conger conger]